MPVFVTLPSGLVVNLAVVRRIDPSDQGDRSVTVVFGRDDTMRLDAEDATALIRRLGATTVAAANVRTMIFWMVIVVALVLVWLAIHR